MKISLVSGSRADFGGLEAVYKALKKCNVDAFLETHYDLAGSGAPDLVVLLGDRFEILQIAVDTYLKKIPIAHLSGGDITEGSQDDCMRHAITKLSHLHFPTNADSAKRIIQMGEEPWRVKVVGYPGVDDLHPDPLPGWAPSEYILAVWHPNTLVSEADALSEATILANSLEVARGNLQVIVIGSNSDAGGGAISEFLKQWAEFTGNIYKVSLPRNQYLGLLKGAECLVGNSSSGFYEAPSFGTSVVNIGDRQKGRVIPSIMVSASIEIDDIVEAINIALANPTMHYLPEKNVYETGNAADKIASEIAKIKDLKKLLLKRFYEIRH